MLGRRRCSSSSSIELLFCTQEDDIPSYERYDFGFTVCCEHCLLGVHVRVYQVYLAVDSKTNEHTLTVSTLDSFIACKHWHRSNPGSRFAQFLNSKIKSNQINALFKVVVDLQWGFQQLPCTRLSPPKCFLPLKNFLSEGSRSLQSFLCNWTGSRVNLGIHGMVRAITDGLAYHLHFWHRMDWQQGLLGEYFDVQGSRLSSTSFSSQFYRWQGWN